MVPNTDTFMLLVHGIDSNRYTWETPLNNGDLMNSGGTSELWRGYLRNQILINPNRAFVFSFSEPSGYHGKNMLELGGAGYLNEASNTDAPNNRGEVKGGILKLLNRRSIG